MGLKQTLMTKHIKNIVSHLHNTDQNSSFQHVNRVYNHVYGHVSRMVVSHMPHLVDKNIFGEMRATFFDEWLATSKHRLRQSDDMQVI